LDPDEYLDGYLYRYARDTNVDRNAHLHWNVYLDPDDHEYHYKDKYGHPDLHPDKYGDFDPYTDRHLVHFHSDGDVHKYIYLHGYAYDDPRRADGYPDIISDPYGGAFRYPHRYLNHHSYRSCVPDAAPNAFDRGLRIPGTRSRGDRGFERWVPYLRAGGGVDGPCFHDGFQIHNRHGAFPAQLDPIPALVLGLFH
jgi:hypothetical protein